MPRGDGTGPMGQGPQTGRGFGPCGTGASKGWFNRTLTGNAGQPGFFQQRSGMGFLGWFGLGSGRGRSTLSGRSRRSRWFNR